jgi:hypothetical protein
MTGRLSVRAALGAALCFGFLPTLAQAQNPQEVTSAAPPACGRECLYRVLDRYLDALTAKDPSRVSWAKMVRYTENNVSLMVGDGLWGTISGLGPYQLRFADPLNGQVGYFGEVKETLTASPFALRLKVEDGLVAEVETVVFRAPDGGILPPPEDPLVDKPVLQELVPPEDRTPRERMISLVNGYFDTLQLNDGTLFTQFDDQCDRFENGTRTTNNPNSKITRVTSLGCAAQFRTGFFRIDDRLRARRYPLVDEERGLVLASAFIDHSGRLGSYRLSDGTVAESRFRRPHTFCVMELFKIQKGKIRQIEAVLITVPYNMPSPWTR